MLTLENVLRKAAREAMGLEDGEYFDSMVFVEQARAVAKHVEKLWLEGDGDGTFSSGS
jgi:hypothetical protein